jgi:hypothetical protein
MVGQVFPDVAVQGTVVQALLGGQIAAEAVFLGYSGHNSNTFTAETRRTQSIIVNAFLSALRASAVKNPAKTAAL